MKSPNNQTEESLRKMMSQRFESYEKEPPALLTQSVFEQLRTRRRQRITQILLACFLLICIGVAGRLLYNTQPRNTQRVEAALSKSPSIPNQSKTISREAQLSNSVPGDVRVKSIKKREPVELNFQEMTPPVSMVEVADPSIPIQVPAENGHLAEPLHFLDSKPVCLNSPALQMPEPIDNQRTPVTAHHSDENQGYKLIVGLIPTSGFQLLDVMPGDGLIYQNFRFAKPVSRQSLGYKFQIGFERMGVQVLLNYSQFSHSVTYDVAGSEFLLIRDEQNNASPVRKTRTIHDDNSVRQLGVGLKKHFLFTKGALRKHYFDLGAEFSKQLGGQNNALWLNTSFGKQLQMPGHISLTIGPYAEYSLHKFKNNNHVYTSVPYQVGVSVGLRLSH